jgi:outer membrane protein insertion porin family
LSKITFKNNRALTNYTALRKLFPIKDGEIFKRSVIAEGLENLRRVYGEYGYANFTSFPGTMTHEKAGTISLTVDFDEGKQFVVSDMHVLGTSDEAAESILRDAPLQPGQVYNQRLAEMTVEHLISLPAGFSPASRIHFKLDEENGTLEITYELQNCGQALARSGTF